MSSKKNTLTPADLDKAYEENDIKLKGIIGFGIGLFLLIVFTFGLMWYFLREMRGYAKAADTSGSPMAMNERDRLPPEPRLQAAPGFGVDSEKGRINLELKAPQSEWREMIKQWDELRENGQTDPKTGATIMLSVEKAKEAFLKLNVKARSGEDAEKFYQSSHKFYSDASAGRVASETRR